MECPQYSGSCCSSAATLHATRSRKRPKYSKCAGCFKRNAANPPGYSTVTNFSRFISRIVCSIHSAGKRASKKFQASIVSPPCAASWPSPASSAPDAVEASFSEAAAASFFICHKRSARLSDTPATRQGRAEWHNGVMSLLRRDGRPSRQYPAKTP